MRGQYNHLAVHLRDQMAEDAYLKEQLEANEIWIAMKSKIHIDELEQILFDVGAEAATTVNLDLSSMQIDDIPEARVDTEMPTIPTMPRKMSDEVDDFAVDETTNVDDFDEPAEEKEEKEEKKVKKEKKEEIDDEDFDFDEEPEPAPAPKVKKAAKKPVKPVEDEDFDFDDFE